MDRYIHVKFKVKEKDYRLYESLFSEEEILYILEHYGKEALDDIIDSERGYRTVRTSVPGILEALQ